MKWCCVGFENHVLIGGQRGMSIIVDAPGPSPPEFVIQHRAVAIGSEASVSAHEPMSLVNETRILFCPWCGVSLAAFYADNANEISRRGLRVGCAGPGAP